MNNIDVNISPLVRNHFPEVYRTEGPLFVLFAEEYYKWMESSGVIVDGADISGASVYHTRKLFEYNDIDQTIDEFIVYFKEKYLKGIDFNTLTSKRKLIKAAQDLFRSKGSTRSIDLLFKLVYGTKIEVYTPGDNILKLSDGKWVVPVYLEVTRSSRTPEFVGSLVSGSKSGASAVIEYIVTRNIKGKLVDILYLSNLAGDFIVGDIINTTGSIEGCPVVIGSLTSVDITLSGQDFVVGEIVNLVSSSGVDAKARVTGIESQTGVVQFAIIEGGWGFSVDANCFVSSKVLTVNSSFDLEESTFGVSNVVYTANSSYEYVSNNVIYLFDKFAVSAANEIKSMSLSKPAIDSTLRGFLNTAVYSTYKAFDYNKNGRADLTDSQAFLKFSIGKSDTTMINWMRNYVMPAAIANSYIKDNYLDYGQPKVGLFTTVVQPLYNITLNNITGDIANSDVFTSENGGICVIASSTQSTYANNATLIIAPLSGNVVADSTISSLNRSIIAVSSNTLFNIGDELAQSNGSVITATGTVASFRSITTVNIAGNTSSNNGLHTGCYILQGDSGASGFISATPRESNFGYTNVSVIAISNTAGVFNNTSSFNVYTDNSNTTIISTATSAGASSGYLYYIENTTGEWVTGNTVYKASAPAVNGAIVIAADVGGKISTYSDITATGNVVGVNASSIGIKDIYNTFYGTGLTKIYFEDTILTPNIVSVSTGTGASFSISIIGDTETVLLMPDFISSNNDGAGSNSVAFKDMLISGANSTYGYMSSACVFDGGSGYSNSDIVVFTGGNTGVGSYGAANASIITDNSGAIQLINLAANVGSGYTTNPSVTINTSTGSGANIHPVFPLGFVKLPGGDKNNTILDLLRAEYKTIGTISTLSNINPGENYNIDPFVLAYEPSVAAYDKRDYIIQISNTSGAFYTDEIIVQQIPINTSVITSNNFIGNTTGQYAEAEYVYTTNGINTTGFGVIRNEVNASGTLTTTVQDVNGTFSNTVIATLLSVSNTSGFNVGANAIQGTANGVIVATNTSLIVVKSVNGTFTNNSTPVSSSGGGSTLVSSAVNNYIYQLRGSTSLGVSDVIDVQNDVESIDYAKARVRSYNANNSTLYANRISLFADFISSGTIIGTASGASATIVSVEYDNNRNPAGISSNISANVVISEGAIANIELIDSGFGYVQDEAIQIISEDSSHAAAGKANIINQGVSEGRYESYDGFLDNYRYIHDGEYYQEYSYEVQSSIPFEKYEQLLREVVHVAGTKMFGRVSTSTLSNNQIVAASSIINIA